MLLNMSRAQNQIVLLWHPLAGDTCTESTDLANEDFAALGLLFLLLQNLLINLIDVGEFVRSRIVVLALGGLMYGCTCPHSIART